MICFYQTGLLAGGVTYTYQAAPVEILDRAAEWAELAAHHGLPLPAVAMAFAGRPVCVAKVVVGCSAVAEVEECCELAGLRVPEELWEEAVAAGLLPSELGFC